MFAITERLLLRPGWADDAAALQAAINDEAVTKMLARVPWPYSLQDARDYLALPAQSQQPSFLIFDRAKGSAGLIGGVGIHDQDGLPEIGYWIASSHWGRGYATEAARAVVQLARHTLRIPRLVSGHFVDNPASGRVLRKIGFRPTGQIEQRECRSRGEQVPCVLLELDLSAQPDSRPLADTPSPQMQMMIAA